MSKASELLKLLEDGSLKPGMKIQVTKSLNSRENWTGIKLLVKSVDEFFAQCEVLEDFKLGNKSEKKGSKFALPLDEVTWKILKD